MMPNRISLLFYFCFFKRLYWQDWQNKNVTYLIHPLHPSCIFSGLGSGWEVGVGGSSCWTTVGTWNDHQSFIFFHQKDFIKQYRWQSRSGRNSRVRRFMSDFECIIRWLVMIIDGMTSFVILFTTWWHFLFLNLKRLKCLSSKGNKNSKSNFWNISINISRYLGFVFLDLFENTMPDMSGAIYISSCTSIL